MPKATSRNSIYEYLRAQPSVTSEDVSRRFGISGATARHHLLLLMEEGRVRVSSTRLKNAKGRPFQVYEVIEKNTAQDLALLISVLIDQSKPTDALIEALATELAGRVKLNHSTQGPNLTLMLIHIVEQLSRLGYKARWEVHRDSPQVIFENCPYSMVENREKLLCPMDVRLLQRMLGQKVRQTKRFEVSESGYRTCKFELD